MISLKSFLSRANNWEFPAELNGYVLAARVIQKWRNIANGLLCAGAVLAFPAFMWGNVPGNAYWNELGLNWADYFGILSILVGISGCLAWIGSPDIHEIQRVYYRYSRMREFLLKGWTDKISCPYPSLSREDRIRYAGNSLISLAKIRIEKASLSETDKSPSVLQAAIDSKRNLTEAHELFLEFNLGVNPDLGHYFNKAKGKRRLAMPRPVRLN